MKKIIRYLCCTFLTACSLAAQNINSPLLKNIYDNQFEINHETLKSESILATQSTPLNERTLENLLVFTKLFGYVRHFHPSDEADSTNWDKFAIEGVKIIEQAKDITELIQKLQDIFMVIAPTVQIFPTSSAPPVKPDVMPPVDTSNLRITQWSHLGYGTGSQYSIYKSERISESVQAGQIPDDFHDPEVPFYADLGGGVSCYVPLALYADDNGTIPRSEKINPWMGTFPANNKPSAYNRSVRFAAVLIVWNILQHFYPYFDVVETDWHQVLTEALTKAATDIDEKTFLNTLKKMVANLHDGHGFVYHLVDYRVYSLPFLWDWIEDKLVLTYVKNSYGLLKPGEIVLQINGKNALDVIQSTEELISGATPQWKRCNALQQLLLGTENSSLKLKMKKYSGDTYIITVKREILFSWLKQSKPLLDKIKEIRPHIFYVDLLRIKNRDFNNSLTSLQQANQIIFDLRGYPQFILPDFLGYFIDEEITSAQWHVPIITYPDYQNVKFDVSNWTVPPLKPKLNAKIIFLTNGEAISYAESLMGMIEHYKLAEIVGQPTAGTNGNVVKITLPGDYEVSFTGMKVLKHDGSQHHGVGILPTKPVSPTIQGVRAGRDEVLEYAIELYTDISKSNKKEIPENFILEQNYPNPFNLTTTIKYQLPVFSNVELSIYNIKGQKVTTLVSEQQPAGNYTFQWNAIDITNGVYFYRLIADDFIRIKKLILLK